MSRPVKDHRDSARGGESDHSSTGDDAGDSEGSSRKSRYSGSVIQPRSKYGAGTRSTNRDKKVVISSIARLKARAKRFANDIALARQQGRSGAIKRASDGRVYRRHRCTNCDEHYHEVGNDDGLKPFGVETSTDEALERTICPPCAAQVDLLASGHSPRLGLTPPWGALVRMTGFLDPNLRCDTAESISEEILELEHEICMNSCAYIMLHAIMGQQSSKSSVESPQPRRDGISSGSFRVRSPVVCDCCKFELWNGLSPDVERDVAVNLARGDEMSEATHLLPRCEGTRLENWDLQGYETPHA